MKLERLTYETKDIRERICGRIRHLNKVDSLCEATNQSPRCQTKDRDSECGNTSLMRLELSSQLALKKGEPFHHDCG